MHVHTQTHLNKLPKHSIQDEINRKREKYMGLTAFQPTGKFTLATGLRKTGRHC